MDLDSISASFVDDASCTSENEKEVLFHFRDSVLTVNCS